MLYELKVADFLNELASDSPAPGGGSVAALAGALSSSLVSMVGRLSGKCENQERIQQIVTVSDQLALELKELIEKDTQAFNKVMVAFKMPKGTEEEKAARRQAIQQGMKDAALTPLEVMEKAIQGMELTQEIAKLGNQNAITDAGVSGLMGYAAVKGAAYNVQVNLLSIKDEDFKREKADRLNELSIKAKELSTEIENIVYKGLEL
ncbi:MAG: cyclodeaminase/cyclohydrolase family protein [Halanaerobiales bacterium]|nr:cyclodeaminase/cyclohydrolase family protein [Halanaerobiales bacterium]